MNDFPFKPVQNAEPARWLVERLTMFGADVLSIVPSGFEAYARVFHPASRVTYTSDGGARFFSDISEPLRWSEVAALTGRRAHRAMQWPSIQGANPSLHDYTTLRAGDAYVAGPEEGSLPVEVAQALWPVLEPFTATRDRCFFAVWEGFGGLPILIHEAPAFETPDRRYHLFEAPVSHLPETFYSNELPVGPGGGTDMFVAFDLEPGEPHPPEAELEAMVAKARDDYNEATKDLPPQHQSANLFWPEDRAWCAHTEIDFNTTYIAGTQRLVDALLACEELEVYQVEQTDGVAYDGDTLNPTPDDPYGGSFRLE